MFHQISPAIQTEMRRLEEIDAQDRADGTPHLQRLRQIPPVTGKFIALLAANTPAGQMIEIGTSAGYSTLWLSLAAKTLERKITTFEILPEKVKLATETFARAQVEDTVELVAGDALAHLAELDEIAFCFLDAEKDVYKACYDLVIPKMVTGAYLVADNVISHQDALSPVVDDAENDPRVDAMVATIGKGLLVCRKL